jgi:hypothetical protein
VESIQHWIGGFSHYLPTRAQHVCHQFLTCSRVNVFDMLVRNNEKVPVRAGLVI